MVIERINPGLETKGPFAAAESAEYQSWRDAKLSLYPIDIKDIFVDMADAQRVTAEARARATSILHRTNFFLYRSDPSIHEGRVIARALAQTFGLKRLDSNLCA